MFLSLQQKTVFVVNTSWGNGERRNNKARIMEVGVLCELKNLTASDVVCSVYSTLQRFQCN
jgi:hypothetical protein